MSTKNWDKMDEFLPRQGRIAAKNVYGVAGWLILTTLIF